MHTFVYVKRYLIPYAWVARITIIVSALYTYVSIAPNDNYLTWTIISEVE